MAVFLGCKDRSFQDFKIYFFRTLCSWSQVLDHGTKFVFVVFADKVILEIFWT